MGTIAIEFKQKERPKLEPQLESRVGNFASELRGTLLMWYYTLSHQTPSTNELLKWSTIWLHLQPFKDTNVLLL